MERRYQADSHKEGEEREEGRRFRKKNSFLPQKKKPTKKSTKPALETAALGGRERGK